MVNSRRVARELALKVLFQVDVGRQPLNEVIEGALAQIRHAVDQPVGQAAQEAAVALRSLAQERVEGLSSQSARQVKQIATASATHLRTLAERISMRTTAMLARPDGDASTTEALVADDAEVIRVELRKLASRDSYQPQILREIGELAEARSRQMEAAFGKQSRPAAAAAELLHQLVSGTTERRAEIDARLTALSEGWALERQAAVDRNIMRLAAYEILFLPDVPAAASINEAVELAKKYSTAESGRFVNGVLGALAGRATAHAGDTDGDSGEPGSAPEEPGAEAGTLDMDPGVMIGEQD